MADKNDMVSPNALREAARRSAVARPYWLEAAHYLKRAALARSTRRFGGLSFRVSYETRSAADEVEFDLLVPSRQESIKFRLKNDGERYFEDLQVIVFRMEPNSWLFRLLVDPLYFSLTVEAPHRVIEFKGRSSVKTDEGENQDLRMVYRYSAR